MVSPKAALWKVRASCLLVVGAPAGAKTVFRPVAVDRQPAGERQGRMCNLYRLNKPAADIAHLFGVEATQGANYSEEVYPGYPGW
jgi:hypothetical protein